MVPEETLHVTLKNGATYRAAGGQKLTNKGEKRIKLKSGEHLGKLNFQALTEVRNPLASAGKIANKGKIIVLDGDGCDSYIFNKASKSKIPIYQEHNVYVMDVDFLVDEENLADMPFRRQV